MGRKQRITYATALGASVLAGSTLAFQAQVNGRLGGELANPYLTAFISFSVGLAALVLMCGAHRGHSSRLPALWRLVRDRATPWWLFTGGLAGAYSVFAQSMSVSVLGVALFTIGVVAGQSASGIALDWVGLGPGGKITLTLPRLLGVVLAVCAAGFAAFDEGSSTTFSWHLLFPLIAGAGISWQTTVNGRLRSATQSTLAAATVNFAIGWIALAGATLVSFALQGTPELWPSHGGLYLGGLLGVLFIAVSAAAVRVVGILVLGLSSILGQLATALAVDLVTPLNAAPSPTMLFSAIVSCVAVAVAAIPARCGRLGARR